jgi:uncharacterized protein (UPF0261 family)
VQGGPFYDPEADQALFDALRGSLSSNVELVEHEADINDPAFAQAMAQRLADYLEELAPR